MASDTPTQQQQNQPFKPPPTTLCLCAPNTCLSRGQKLHSPSQICTLCLTRHDPHHLFHLAALSNHDSTAISTINTEIARKQQLKSNIEARGKFLCAFEDPDYVACEWRGEELNLKTMRGTGECMAVKRKGKACEKCWKRWREKVGVMKFFTAWGIVWDEAGGEEASGVADKDEGEDEKRGFEYQEEYAEDEEVVEEERKRRRIMSDEDVEREIGQETSSMQDTAAGAPENNDDDDDDIEGYNVILG